MTAPIAIEVRLPDGSTVRGHELPESGPPVVFVHEPGCDLDAWGSRTAQFARRGFKVLALDLPGHGLSDGEPGDWEAGLTSALSQIGFQWGPLGVVAAGDTCRAVLSLGAEEGVPVQVMLSPPEVDAGCLRRSAPSTRLLMCGPADHAAHEATKTVFAGVRGQKLMITGGGDEQGANLIRVNGHLLDELVMWFRRNLTAYHLAWISEITSKE